MRCLVTWLLIAACDLGAANASVTVAQFFITNYGAKAGGDVLCTTAIVEAVTNAANAYRTTGQPAEVVVTAGNFLTGAFSLDTGVTLRLDAGAVLLASTKVEDYPTSGWRSRWRVPSLLLLV